MADSAFFDMITTGSSDSESDFDLIVEKPRGDLKRKRGIDTKETIRVPDLSGGIVGVLAGKKLLHVHADVLTTTSEFLKNAMKPEWRTDASLPVDLSDERTTTVEIYCQWLYSRKIASEGKTLFSSLPDLLVRLYLFGAFLLDPTFQNAVLDAMIDYATAAMSTHLLPSPNNIKAIYKNTPKGDPARRLVVDLHVYHADRTVKGVMTPSLFQGTDFLEELVPMLFVKRGKPGGDKPWERSGAYHHGGDEVDTTEKAGGSKRRKVVRKVVDSSDSYDSFCQVVHRRSAR